MDRRRYSTLPFIPRPQKKEEPVVEELVREPEGSKTDHRPALKQEYAIREARFNRLYGSDRVQNSWRWRIDEYATGTITSIANAQATATVTLANDPYWRLSRWPGARQLFLCLRSFSLCPRVSLTTVGNLACLYQDATTGRTIPLGVFPSTSGGNDSSEILLSPITDPDNLTLGIIQVTLNGTSPSTGTYDYQIGFSAAYLLPELRGYDKPFYEVRGELDEKSLEHHLK